MYPDRTPPAHAQKLASQHTRARARARQRWARSALRTDMFRPAAVEVCCR
jgi:hypothetical protein